MVIMNFSGSSRLCTLLGGTFAAVIQASLALVCVGTLIVKRQHETPRRDWFVWFLDVMKQGIGSVFGHFANIYLSILIAQSLPRGTADQCQWYGLTYIVDCTVGTFWNLLFLQCFELIVSRNKDLYSIFNFGDYGNPPQLKIFFPQLFVWLVIVITGKILIILVIYQFILPINHTMIYLFRPLKNHPDMELVTVMIFIPACLNVLQFWVTDTFLKRQVSEFPTEIELSRTVTSL